MVENAWTIDWWQRTRRSAEANIFIMVSLKCWNDDFARDVLLISNYYGGTTLSVSIEFPTAMCWWNIMADCLPLPSIVTTTPV
jgi:hypothetical protein